MKSHDIGPFTIDRFESDGRVFVLNAPIECVCRRSRGTKSVWCYEYEPITLMGYSYDRQEAWDDFNEAFAFDWDEIAQEDDCRLSPDAIRLKNQLLAMVRTVIAV